MKPRFIRFVGLAFCIALLAACGRKSLRQENAQLQTQLRGASEKVSRAESEAALHDMAQIFADRSLRAQLAGGSLREAEWFLQQERPNAALAKLMRSHELAPDDARPIIRAVNLLSYRNFPRQLAQSDLASRPYIVRFSPDGKRVALGGEDGLAHLFDVASRKTISVPFKHYGTMKGLAFNFDGSLLASAGGDPVVRLWDAATGEARGALRLQAPIEHLEFSRNGRRLLTRAEDHSVAIWDIVTAKPLFPPHTFPGDLRAARLHPEGKAFVTATGEDIDFWSADSGERIPRALMASSPVDNLEYSEDGTKLLVTNGREVTLYASASIRRICGPIRHESTLTATALDPRGTRIFTAAEDFAVRMWSAEDGGPMGEPLRNRRIVRDIRFDRTGQLCITASYDGSARVWQTEDGKAYTEPLRHLAEVETADLSPDGTLAITASQARVMHLWDIRDGRLRSLPIAAIGGLDAVQSLPDREIVASTPDDGRSLRLWDATHQKQVGTDIVPGSPIMQVRVSPDGRRLVTRGQDNNLRIWDTATGVAVGQAVKLGGPPSRLDMDPESRRLLAVVEGSVFVVDLTAAAPRGLELTHTGHVTDVRFDPTTDRIVTGTFDGFVHLWNASTGAAVWPPIQHVERISAVSFSPEGQRILAGCYDGTARLYDANTAAPVGNRMEHHGPVLDASFSMDGLQIITGGTDGTARIWDAETTAAAGAPFVHKESVWRARLDTSGRWLQVQIGELPTDAVPRLWDVSAHKPAVLPPGLILTLSSDPRETRILAGFAEGKTLVINARSGRVAGLPLLHHGALSTALFSTDGKHILTTSWDATARLWDSDSNLALTDPIEHEQPVTAGALSPDGQRIITVQSERDIHVWELGPINEPVPEWFPQLITAIAGQAVSTNGVVTPVTFDRAEAVEEIRQQLAALPADDAWAVWGRWFLDDRSKRTISPLASVTMPQYVDALIARNTLESLREASRLCAGDMVKTQIIQLRRAALVAEATPLK